MPSVINLRVNVRTMNTLSVYVISSNERSLIEVMFSIIKFIGFIVQLTAILRADNFESKQSVQTVMFVRLHLKSLGHPLFCVRISKREKNKHQNLTVSKCYPA